MHDSIECHRSVIIPHRYDLGGRLTVHEQGTQEDMTFAGYVLWHGAADSGVFKSDVTRKVLK